MVTTRRHQQDDQDATVVQRRTSGRERKPPKPILTMIEQQQEQRHELTGKGKQQPLTGKGKGKQSSSSMGWVQIRKEQVQQKKAQKEEQSQKRKTIPNVLTDPYTGDTVWIATATLQDIALGSKRNRPPWLLSQRFLVTVPSLPQRQAVYHRAAMALADIEQRILPTYGTRLQWKCIVTIKEAVTTTSTSAHTKSTKNKKVSLSSSLSSSKSASSSTTATKTFAPYFCWNKRGQLEIAAWPYMMEKIPTPPHFPGYYKNGNSCSKSTSSTKKSTKKKEKKKQKKHQQQVELVEEQKDSTTITTTIAVSDDIDVTSNNNNNVIDTTSKQNETEIILTEKTDDSLLGIENNNNNDEKDDDDDQDDDDDEEDEEDDEDDEDEEILSDEMIEIRELQNRMITGLAELAYNERWRVPIPTIQYKWISPLQQTFYTRKSAWDHAVQLCQNDIVLDKVLHGYGANGKKIVPQLPTQSTTYRAGQLRFVRDGLWIIGQEEQWIYERQQEQEEEEAQKVEVANVTNAVISKDENIIAPTDSNTKPQQSRPWTGLTLFIHKTRMEYRQKRIQEIQQDSHNDQNKSNLVSPSPTSTASTVNKNTLDVTDSSVSSGSSSDHHIDPITLRIAIDDDPTLTSNSVQMTPPPRTSNVISPSDTCSVQSPSKLIVPIKRFTLIDAAKELRGIWKDMSKEDKLQWDNDAKHQNDVDDLNHNNETKAESVMKKSDSKKKSSTKFDRYKKWCLNDEQIKLCYNAGVEHYDQIMRTVTARDLFRELQDGFDLLRERGTGRWDMTLPEFDTITYSFVNDTNRSPWMPVVREILGKDVVLIHKGIFLSMPGSSKQIYHQDGPHLTTQYQKPCHAINVFVPLIDLTLENGPTEFCLGSHTLGYDELDEKYTTIPLVSAGTPIIFDYRLGHRGLGNSSTTCRPILYCTYAASADGKEFRDSVNFSRKRYHRIGDLVEKGLTRAERAEKRQRTLEDHQVIDNISSCSAIVGEVEIVPLPSSPTRQAT